MKKLIDLLNKTSIGLLCLAAMLVFVAVGCDNSLDVENPNSLIEDDLSNPIAANAIANGALATTAQGIAYVLAPFNTATDEVIWTGSRDAWRELDFGNVSFDGNEFTDNAMKYLHEGRWMSDKAILQLSEFDANNAPELDRSDLGRAYLYAALARVYIADWFDDWAFSDKREPAPNIGEANMNSVYNDAIANLDQALSIARSEGNAGLEVQILALRARAQHALAIWGLLNPKGSVPGNPWVNAGRSDAEAALGLMGDDNYRWQLFYAPGAEWNDFAWQVNGRLELNILSSVPGGESVLVNDPIDGIPDPRMAAAVAEFRDIGRWAGTNYSPLTVVSAREMYLIIAESDLASGNSDAAKAMLNTIRAITEDDNLTALDGQMSVGDLLQHERRANLFLQGRRLADMYRFGVKDPMWQSNSDAFTTPGSFLPITIAEKQANPLIQ